MDNRSFESASSASPPSAPASPSVGYPTNGNPSLAIPATIPGDYWFYQIGEELRAMIETGGLTPAAGTLTQLRDAILSTQAPIQGAFKNLAASATGLSATITATADEIAVETASNVYKTLRSVSLSINSAGSGANGLDTGTIAASTWYSVWVIYNPTTSTTAGLISLSATAPTLPSGYTYKARIGWVRTDGTANKYPLSFKQVGRRSQLVIAAGSNLTALPVMANGISTGNVATGNFVPPTASEIAVYLGGNIAVNTGGGTGPSAVYTYGNGGNAPLNCYNANTNGIQANGYAQFVLESTNIHYSSDSANLTLSSAGWVDNF